MILGPRSLPCEANTPSSIRLYPYLSRIQTIVDIILSMQVQGSEMLPSSLLLAQQWLNRVNLSMNPYPQRCAVLCYIEEQNWVVDWGIPFITRSSLPCLHWPILGVNCDVCCCLLDYVPFYHYHFSIFLVVRTYAARTYAPMDAFCLQVRDRQKEINLCCAPLLSYN